MLLFPCLYEVNPASLVKFPRPPKEGAQQPMVSATPPKKGGHPLMIELRFGQEEAGYVMTIPSNDHPSHDRVPGPAGLTARRRISRQRARTPRPASQQPGITT